MSVSMNPSSPPATKTESARPLSVLVVEDDVATRETLCAAIAAQTEMQIAASFGAVVTALAWLERNSTDVLLTDLGLPDGSGIEVIKACATRYPLCDILVITMFGDEKNVIDSMDAGAMGYILKDADDLNVAKFIKDLRQGGSPMSPRVARKLLMRVQRLDRPADVHATSPNVNVLEPLTHREAEVLDLIARGYSYLEIGEVLGVSISTVQTHIKRIYAKLSVHTRSQAIFEASKLGLLQVGLMSKDSS
jgi:DNA-binding NarL/FixJ family response regulator